MVSSQRNKFVPSSPSNLDNPQTLLLSMNSFLDHLTDVKGTWYAEGPRPCHGSYTEKKIPLNLDHPNNFIYRFWSPYFSTETTQWDKPFGIYMLGMKKTVQDSREFPPS